MDIPLISVITGYIAGTAVTILLMRYTLDWLGLRPESRGVIRLMSDVDNSDYDCAGNVTGEIVGTAPYPCAIWAVVDTVGHPTADPHTVTHATRILWSTTTGIFTISNPDWPTAGALAITIWREHGTQFGATSFNHDCGTGSTR